MDKRFLYIGFCFWLCNASHSLAQVVFTDTISDINRYQKQISEELLILTEIKEYQKNLKSLKKHLNYKNENEQNFINKLESAKDLLDKYNYEFTNKNITIIEERFKISDNLMTTINIYFCFSSGGTCDENIQFVYDKSSNGIRNMIVNKKIDEENFFDKFPELKGK